MHDDVAQVVSDAARHREKFEAFCRSLSDEEARRPIPESHWQVRDYISHLASMDIWMSDWYEAMAGGPQFIPRGEDGGPCNIDTWNDARIEERKGASVEDLLAEAAEHRVKLVAIMERFEQPALDSRMDFRGNNITFMQYLRAWTLHDPAHSADMLRALPERRDDPELRAWLDELSGAAMREVADVESRPEGS